jgi:hypothetical protein
MAYATKSEIYSYTSNNSRRFMIVYSTPNPEGWVTGALELRWDQDENGCRYPVSTMLSLDEIIYNLNKGYKIDNNHNQLEIDIARSQFEGETLPQFAYHTIHKYGESFQTSWNKVQEIETSVLQDNEEVDYFRVTWDGQDYVDGRLESGKEFMRVDYPHSGIDLIVVFH